MKAIGVVEAAEHALIVARIRGRLPQVVYLPNYFNQGISSFRWNQQSQQYVELKEVELREHRSTEEKFSNAKQPIRKSTASAAGK